MKVNLAAIQKMGAKAFIAGLITAIVTALLALLLAGTSLALY